MWEFDTEFSEIIQRTRDIKSFRFPISDKKASYLPGQFFYLTIKVKGEDAEHHFSFSSSPTDEDYIEFTKRITASDYSQTLNVTKPGDWAYLSGPDGDFILPDKTQTLCFLSGGIGITPLRSMLRHIVANKLHYDVVLLYGNNSYEDIPFREELMELITIQSGIRVEHVLSGSNVPPDWKGKRGLINQALIRELVPDFMQRLFYISGPPKMVKALSEQVIALGVSEDNVKNDSFLGY